MRTAIKRQQVLDLARKTGVIRAADVLPMGVTGGYLSDLAKNGYLHRLGRGLFSLPDSPYTEYRSLVEAAAYAPKAVVCLLSALAFHGIGTQLPHAVWLAIGRKDRAPQVPTVAVEIVRMAPRFLEDGVQTHLIEGVSVRITSAVRTVVDCFKYRSRVGSDVAIEALRDGFRNRRFTADELYHYARLERVWNVLKPYAEAVA
jgi:predicted transcriptional regulator of viral defense system